MQIVDTHCHVISKDEAKYPHHYVVHFDWVAPHAVDLDELLKSFAEAGVNKATIVQSISGHGYDNSYTMDSVRAHPEMFTGVGVIDPLEQDAALTVRRLIEDDNMTAVRLFANHQGVEAFAIDDERTFPIWEVAATEQIPVILYVLYQQLPQVEHMLEKFPQVDVAIDHMAMVPVGSAPAFREAAPLLELASYPNLYLKWSTNNLESCDNAGVPFIDFFQHFIDAYGAQRLMWGSNYPARSQPSYKALVERALTAIAPLSQTDQEFVMGGTALRLWPVLT